MNRLPRQHGYALLMTLLLLVIACVCMAGMGRRSMARALEALRATDQLQERWAARSCRHTVAPRIEAVLARIEQRSNQPVPVARLELTMSGRPVTLILSDEQAKASINALSAHHGPARAEQAVRSLLAANRAAPMVRLRPLPSTRAITTGDGGNPTPAFSTWTQVFSEEKNDVVLRDSLNHDAALTARVTLWGDGRVNIRRAPAVVIEQACAPWLDAADAARLVALRDAAPGLSLEHALDQLQLPDARRRKALPLLTDRSACHGLWIIATRDGRARVEFVVSEQSGQMAAIKRFLW